MGFDEEVDQLKQELLLPKLSEAEQKAATSELADKLKKQLSSKRLGINFENVDGDDTIVITHTQTQERLAYVSVSDDRSVVFQSSLSEDDSTTDALDDEGYFPPYIEFYNEEEFLSEAPEMLKQGLAEYELDQDEDD
ncbi:MAG: hypothetical protein P8Y67_10715 [Alphaproteobacteria bacterium]